VFATGARDRAYDEPKYRLAGVIALHLMRREFVELSGNQRAEQSRLGREVAVERPGSDAGSGGGLIDRERCSFLLEELRGCRE
jgi:hypothetical protein